MNYSVSAITRALSKSDPKRAKVIRRQAHRILGTDKELQQVIAEEAHGIMVAAMPHATAALARRASKGNPQAIKLLFEASGFHNPKLQHEHSGEVKITVDLPRPPVVDIDEADVVEE